MPARSYTRQQQSDRQFTLPMVAWILGITAAALVLTYVVNYKSAAGSLTSSVVGASVFGPSAPAANEPVKTYHIVFDPPFPLTQEQRDFQKMAKDIIVNPSSWGVVKPPLNFDPNLLELYTGSVLWSENHLSHYDLDGNVAYSYGGCCLGGAQVSETSSVCPLDELKDQRYNLWCGAKIFIDYYNSWGVKAGDRANEITVAMYKNAIVTNDDGSPVLDENGLPTIPPDDPDNPYDFASQVQSAFVYHGETLFKFVADN